MSIFKKFRKNDDDTIRQLESSFEGVGFTADKVIEIIRTLAEMDISVTPGFFQRHPGIRYQTLGDLILKVTGSKTANLQYISPAELRNSPERISSGYSDILRETYELATQLEVLGTVMHEHDVEVIREAIKMWEIYLQYSGGYADQAERNKIALKRVQGLKNSV